MTHNEWKAKHARLSGIADRVSEYRRLRAKRLCFEAGLDPGLLGIHPHNAMVSRHYGKPWPGVNYSKVRACVRVIESMYVPSSIVTRWDRRVRGLSQ